ncbi:hypothetical protein J5N97_009241 [Dioscorea zingiberensis]|uniref:SAP domain-containing protein n=1 Tax=Dioscorea zingiberensis TaxID=325984 RepID=A0A9D5HLS5_9LILI|nr:hypothetical protein J5N97_009241 [Dioscorea zingiberensis]
MPSTFELKSSSMDDEYEQFRKEVDGEVSEDDYDGNSDEKYEYSINGEKDDDDGGDEGLAAGQDLCCMVIDLLERGKSLDVLKLNQCKAYLRKHSLRLSGTKATCIERIQEHWRIKHGNAEILYPKSSFVINCTGDACKGDVVLFMQRIFAKGANVIGKRIVAGRIVKESYGAAKQQHTFTVEILWSEGVQALPPLFPLRVKGRNLYRLKTFRQPWTDEAERSKVLDEKHKRGAAARHARAIAKFTNANKDFKHPKMSSSKGMPPKRERMAEMLPSRPSCSENQAQFGALSLHYPHYNVAYPYTPSGMIRQELLNPSHYNDYRYNSYSSQIDPRTSGHPLRHVELNQRSACPSVMQFSGRRRQW